MFRRWSFGTRRQKTTSEKLPKITALLGQGFASTHTHIHTSPATSRAHFDFRADADGFSPPDGGGKIKPAGGMNTKQLKVAAVRTMAAHTHTRAHSPNQIIDIAAPGCPVYQFLTSAIFVFFYTFFAYCSTNLLPRRKKKIFTKNAGVKRGACKVQGQHGDEIRKFMVDTLSIASFDKFYADMFKDVPAAREGEREGERGRERGTKKHRAGKVQKEVKGKDGMGR